MISKFGVRFWINYRKVVKHSRVIDPTIAVEFKMRMPNAT